MSHPKITLGGAVMAAWFGFQTFATLAGAHADGWDFLAWIWGWVRPMTSSLAWDVLMTLVGLALVAWGRYGGESKTASGFDARDNVLADRPAAAVTLAEAKTPLLARVGQSEADDLF